MTKELGNKKTEEQKNRKTKFFSLSVSQFFSPSVSRLVGFLVLLFFSFSVASAAGVIEDAPRLSTVGLNILKFLLSIFGIIAIIAIVVAGVFYLTSGGSERQIEQVQKRRWFMRLSGSLWR